MSLGTILVIILVVILITGGVGNFRGGPFFGTGHWGGGGIGLLLIILLVLVLSGRL